MNGRDTIPYGCDCNNFSPRFAFAWRPGRGWVARASYTVSFAEIPQVTYQQMRNNLPLVRYVQVQNPDLLNPLRGINLTPIGNAGALRPRSCRRTWSRPIRTSTTSASSGVSPSGYSVRLGYVGSRTFKLIDVLHAEPRRAGAGYPADHRHGGSAAAGPALLRGEAHLLNGGIAYMDAAQASIRDAGAARLGLVGHLHVRQGH